MPMITKPVSISKNVAAEITLDKSVLAAVASVAADTYFGDSSNWSEVLIYYKSNPGSQREILKFDATQETPTANFLVSEKARDVFEVQKVVIKDFDHDIFTVERSELVVVDFDVTLGGGNNLLTVTGWTSDVSSLNYQATASSVGKILPAGWNFNAVSNEQFSGNISVEFFVGENFSGVVGLQSVPVNSSKHGIELLDFCFYIGPAIYGYALLENDTNISPITGGVSSGVLDKLKIVLNRQDNTIDFLGRYSSTGTWASLSFSGPINYLQNATNYNKPFKQIASSFNIGVAIYSENGTVYDIQVSENV